MKRTHPRKKSRKQKAMEKRITLSLKRKSSRLCSKEEIVKQFLKILNDVKVYHWNTHSFSQHKATDELYERLNEHIDKFVEVLLGKKDARLNKMTHHTTNSNFRQTIYDFRDYLINMNSCLEGESDLLNIRDEILADINQFLYLLTLNK
jgi:DNA-binding ferritin-like protein